MLMTSIQLQNGSDPLRPLPFLNVIEALNGSDAIEALVCSQDLPDSIPKPSRDHPEGKTKEKLGNGKARSMLSQVDDLGSGTHPLVEAEGGVALVLGLEAGERDGSPSPTL